MKPCVLQWFLNTRLSRQRLSAQLSVVFCGLVVHRPPARNRKTRGTAGLRVAVTLVWLLGPRAPPEAARRGPGAPKGTQNTTDSWDFQKSAKSTAFQKCAPLCIARPILAKTGPEPNANHDGQLCFSSWPYKRPAGAPKSEGTHRGVF